MKDSRGAGLLVVAVLVWLALFALSFAVAAWTEPTDSGFTRGLNRVAVFLGWQLAALAVAIAAAVATRRRRGNLSRPLRLVGYAPIAAHLFLALFIGFAVLRAVVGR